MESYSNTCDSKEDFPRSQQGTHTSPFIRARFDVFRKCSEDDIHTLPDLVEFNARHNGNHLFCLQNEGNSYIVDLKAITFTELDRCMRECALTLSKEIHGMHVARKDKTGKLQKSPPVVLFLESGLTFFTHFLALLYMGVPVAVMSARLSVRAISHLVKKSQAQTIITSERSAPLIEEVQLESGDSKLQVHFARPYRYFLIQHTISKPIPYEDICCREVDADDCGALIFHSSGTTGLPKPIYLAQAYPLGYAACHLFAADRVDAINVTTLPLYHGFGLLAPCLSLSIGQTCCFPNPSTAPTAESTIALLKQANAKSLMTVPSIVEDLSRMPGWEAIATLKSLDFVAVGGGPIKTAIGDQFAAAGVPLVNHYGATEIGAIAPIFVPDPEYDWHYLRLRQDIGLELLPVDDDNDDDESGEGLRRLVGHPFGWGKPFELADRLISNPKNPHTEFKVKGRVDDLIILATGEKVMPQVMESTLVELPSVKAALVFGEGQFELGILIEPSSTISPSQSPDFVSSIWPSIAEANRLMDAHAQILFPEAVILTGKRSIPRSDKGSMMRKEAYNLFKKEIKETYQALEGGHVGVSGALSKAVDFDQNPEKSIELLVLECLGNYHAGSRTKPLRRDDDFFERGFDSLRAARFRRLLLSMLPQWKKNDAWDSTVDLGFVYANPTVNGVAEALRALGGNATSLRQPERSREDKMRDMLHRFALTEQRIDETSSHQRKTVVLLTGSTGSLGCHLLSTLLQLPTIASIICLNRPHQDGTGRSRQEAAFARQKINIGLEAWSRIELLDTDTKSMHLGLTEDAFKRYQASVSHVIHNAWPMDFNRRFESFQGQFQALRNLLIFTAGASSSSKRRPRFLFTSSIAVVAHWPSNTSKTASVPETAVSKPTISSSLGYAEAKWVCEQMVLEAAKTFTRQVEACVVRIGQVTGAESSGCWSEREHIPAMVRSAQTLKCLPQINGSLSWLPCDRAASTISEILLHSDPLRPVYHVENPQRVPWSMILESLPGHIASYPEPEMVTLQEWLRRVSDAVDVPVGKNPARALIEFFRGDFVRLAAGDVVLDTNNACSVSSTLRSTAPLTKLLIGKYVEYWKSIGYLAT